MKKQKVGVIVQARMGSTRLPGKVLKRLYKKDRVLDILIKRLKLCNELDAIIITTTPDEKNQEIINAAKNHNVLWFVGNEKNVLERYYQTATEFNLNMVVRVTSDNPFTDPNIIDDMIIFYKTHKLDYIRCLDENFNTPVGFGVEVFSYEALIEAYKLANTKIEKEHVTYFIYKNPNRFSCSYYVIKNLKIIDDFRLTIDYYEDLIVCREVYKKLMEKKKSIEFSIFDVLEIIEENNEILEINKYIKKRPIR